MKTEEQLSLQIPFHGGSRKRSGRKKSLKDELPHKKRERVDKRTPLHINFKLIPQAPGLRTPKFMRALPKIIRNAREKGLRVQQYTIESNHIHLIAEADDNEAVERGMSSLQASIVWTLRRIFMFHGRLFTTRYHIHLLKTPTEMKNALRYVLYNHAKHTKTAFFADVYSSVFGFKDADAFVGFHLSDWPPWFREIQLELVEAKSWMQTVGWQRGKAATVKQN